MAQRVMIAMMLATKPKLLIADEPTSALDVTTQAQILALLKELIQEYHSSVMLITHDLGVVVETCDSTAVMYAGTIVEYSKTYDVIKHPKHPYTIGLLKTIPDFVSRQDDLYSIQGSVPNLIEPPPGCRFHPRCPHAMPVCKEEKPPVITLNNHHLVACFLFT
jgi:peptide/nickel transport system ATP-binding protein